MPTRVKSLIEKKMENPEYRKRQKKRYKAFLKEVRRERKKEKIVVNRRNYKAMLNEVSKLMTSESEGVDSDRRMWEMVDAIEKYEKKHVAKTKRRVSK